jgi:SNF2 family DNA or RNA helicase
LIVCPTSLVFNWVAEAKKFTPELEKSSRCTGRTGTRGLSEIPRTTSS